MLRKELDQQLKQSKESEQQLKCHKREKELMMATYSRIIKENERLHSALQKAKNESTRHIDDKLLRILELKLNGCLEQLEALKKLVPLYEQKIFDGQQRISESEMKQREAEVCMSWTSLFQDKLERTERELHKTLTRP